MPQSSSDKKKTENEAVFRQHNEKVQKSVDEFDNLVEEINDGSKHFDDSLKIVFRCECSDENCSDPITLELREYTKIHKDRDQFIVKPGHQTLDIENIVEKRKTYNIVSKHETPSENSPTLSETDVNNATDYSLVFSNLPGANLLLDNELNVIAASKKFYELSMSDEAIVGKNIFKAFAMNESTKKAQPEQNHDKVLNEVLQTKQYRQIPVQRYDLKLANEQGGGFVTKWWQIDYHPILDSNFDVVYVLQVVEDITARIDADQQA